LTSKKKKIDIYLKKKWVCGGTRVGGGGVVGICNGSCEKNLYPSAKSVFFTL